jgi:membrane-associated phospholipid phosphatase
LRYAWTLSLLNAVWFVFVYGGCDALTVHRGLRVPVHIAAELRIPFVPGMVVFYMSIYLLFLAGPFILRSRREFRALIVTLAAVILSAGVGFLLVPAELAFPAPSNDQLGVWTGLFHLADRANLTYNLAPSLHVALSVVCIAAFATRAEGMGKALLWIWAAGIALSTLLTHQHHVVDVLTAWLLASLGMTLIYSRLSCRGKHVPGSP